MILYHPEVVLNLKKYGILIPLRENRSQKTVNELQKRRGIEIHPFERKLEPLSYEDLRLAHDLDYLCRLTEPQLAVSEVLQTFELYDEKGEPHRYHPEAAEFELAGLIEDVRRQAAMTFETMKASLDKGFAYHLGGGMHHAMSFGGRGFCLINDIVIGIRKLQELGMIHQAWVIDVDAHKGDGTAEITKHDDSIHTFSLHMAKGWPLEGERRDAGGKLYPWFIPSSVDIEIGEGQESAYIDKLQAGIFNMWERFPEPDLVVINQGADPFEGDELPSTQGLKISEQVLLERDHFLETTFEERGIPRAYLMSGGYGEKSYQIYANFLAGLSEEKLLP